jgi:hemerythrin
MAPSDSALLNALHTAEYKLVISERTKYAQKHFKGYDRWMMM